MDAQYSNEVIRREPQIRSSLEAVGASFMWHLWPPLQRLISIFNECFLSRGIYQRSFCLILQPRSATCRCWIRSMRRTVVDGYAAKTHVLATYGEAWQCHSRYSGKQIIGIETTLVQTLTSLRASGKMCKYPTFNTRLSNKITALYLLAPCRNDLHTFIAGSRL